MIYLSKIELLLLNKILIRSTGGFYIKAQSNLKNPNSLEWLIKAVKEKHFDVKRYRSVNQIAAAYCFYIINDHIFNDGNKRTGTLAALIFLKKNGYSLKNNITEKDIEKLAVNVQKKDWNIQKLTQWFEKGTKR